MHIRVLSVTCALAVFTPASAVWAGDAATVVGPRVVYMPTAASTKAPDAVKPTDGSPARSQDSKSASAATTSGPMPARSRATPPSDIKPQQAEAKPQQAEAKPQQAEAKPQQAEAKPQQAEAKPQQAEAKPQQAEAKPQQAEAKPQQAEAKPQQAEAKPQQAEAKPQQAEAKSQQAQAKPQQAAASAKTPVADPVKDNVLATTAPASETAPQGAPALADDVPPRPRGADGFALRPRKAAARPSPAPSQPVAVILPPPDANLAPAYDQQAPPSFNDAGGRRPSRIAPPRVGAEAFPAPTVRVRKIETVESVRRKADVTPTRFQTKCQSSWGKLAGDGPYGVCILN